MPLPIRSVNVTLPAVSSSVAYRNDLRVVERITGVVDANQCADQTACLRFRCAATAATNSALISASAEVPATASSSRAKWIRQRGERCIGPTFDLSVQLWIDADEFGGGDCGDERGVAADHFDLELGRLQFVEKSASRSP